MLERKYKVELSKIKFFPILTSKKTEIPCFLTKDLFTKTKS